LQPLSDVFRRFKYVFGGDYAMSYARSIDDTNAFQEAGSRLNGTLGLVKNIFKDRFRQASLFRTV
jgi:hypothetical protein